MNSLIIPRIRTRTTSEPHGLVGFHAAADSRAGVVPDRTLGDLTWKEGHVGKYLPTSKVTAATAVGAAVAAVLAVWDPSWADTVEAWVVVAGAFAGGWVKTEKRPVPE